MRGKAQERHRKKIFAQRDPFVFKLRNPKILHYDIYFLETLFPIWIKIRIICFKT